ncbi:MAG: hypothetical protein GY938_17825 [Ketobacter sp.]|nr:hypothetical protein [Ketobacter sp.]
MFDISVIGDKKLERKLNKMEKKASSKVMRDAMKESMEPVKELAKLRAPRDKGLLIKSIRIAAKTSRRGVSAMVRTGTRKQLKISADNPFYYPAAHEYGTKYMPAKSYLRSALGDKKNMVLSDLGRSIHKMLAR